MKVLAFDTATEICSVALWVDGELHERVAQGQRHAEKILVLVDEVLAEGGVALNGLDALAFGRGPGSFTGLRIGAGIAQGLAYGAELPVVPVSTLAAIAQGVGAAKVLAAIDARMQQVYWGAYLRDADGLMRLQGDEVVIAPSDVPVPDEKGWTGAGSGWDQYAQVLHQRLGASITQWRSSCYPRAGAIGALGAAGFAAGRAVPAEQALPVYIRDNVAVKQKER